MDFDLTHTTVVFVALVAIGVIGLITAPIPMGTDTILMMVAPSMAVFGLICVAIGVKHGEFRTRSA